jgi:plastocyanin
MRGPLAAAFLVALGVSASPASAADVTIANFEFSPPSITIAQGDKVTWHWAGPDTNHSVTSDSGQADSWDSDPGKFPSAADHPPTDTFDHTFNTAGTFTYLCKVHSSMTGRVIVNGPGGGPPPDTTAPSLTGLKATGGRKCRKGVKKCKPKPTLLRFKLSEAAQVKVRVPKHSAANTTRTGKAGANTVKLSTKKLPPGKWTVKLTATDAAGNASPAKPVKVTVRG